MEKSHLRLPCAPIFIPLVLAPALLLAQAAHGSEPALKTGQQVYRAACVACHGPNGNGAERSSVGFENRLFVG